MKNRVILMSYDEGKSTYVRLYVNSELITTFTKDEFLAIESPDTIYDMLTAIDYDYDTLSEIGDYTCISPYAT